MLLNKASALLAPAMALPPTVTGVAAGGSPDDPVGGVGPLPWPKGLAVLWGNESKGEAPDTNFALPVEKQLRSLQGSIINKLKIQINSLGAINTISD